MLDTMIDGIPARWSWWPIRVHWSFRRKSPVRWQFTWFQRHGIVHWIRGRDGRYLVTQVWHVGLVKIILGKF